MLEAIELVETSRLFSNKPSEASHILGLQQIDTIWMTPNFTLSVLSIIPYYFAVGDHRYFIIDFPMHLFMGEGFIPIARPEMRRLTLSQKGAVN